MESVKVEKNYNLKDVAYILGIKLRTAREWVHNGNLKQKNILTPYQAKAEGAGMLPKASLNA